MARPSVAEPSSFGLGTVCTDPQVSQPCLLSADRQVCTDRCPQVASASGRPSSRGYGELASAEGLSQCRLPAHCPPVPARATVPWTLSRHLPPHQGDLCAHAMLSSASTPVSVDSLQQASGFCVAGLEPHPSGAWFLTPISDQGSALSPLWAPWNSI